jgi:hypothetical protein
VLSGCGGDDDPSAAPTTTSPVTTAAQTSTTAGPPTTFATRSADALKAALLTPADVPGSKALTGLPADVDLSSCVPNNPLAAKSDPNEVKAPGIQNIDAGGQRRYVVKVRQASPEQAKAFVATWATPAGSACITEVHKAGLKSTSAKADVSGLKGSGTTASVGDAGAVVTITGRVTGDGAPADVKIDLLVFQKGAAVVFLSVLGGPSGGAETLDLARKVAGRL